MQLNAQVAARRHFQKPVLCEMHRLRAKVFCERKGWAIPTMSGMEIDGYDAIDPVYMLMHEPNGQLRGCWRLLPTEGPYMLKDTFPELLYGVPAPESPRIWELSRFTLETDGQHTFGFSNEAIQSISEVMNYGHDHGIEQYVIVTTTSIERMLRRAGAVMSRFGPPFVIGVETTVALSIDIAATLEALIGKPRPTYTMLNFQS
ncbi:acyl-homoserine-lactone synthase [Undibacterium sp. Ji22W]|uniref:acyl-homoserine-lactone synthase n=1 Tax=Undibacterium sp. Ji22W TaxID=3413038 RepID=UPI003BF35ABF